MNTEHVFILELKQHRNKKSVKKHFKNDTLIFMEVGLGNTYMFLKISLGDSGCTSS